MFAIAGLKTSFPGSLTSGGVVNRRRNGSFLNPTLQDVARAVEKNVNGSELLDGFIYNILDRAFGHDNVELKG